MCPVLAPHKPLWCGRVSIWVCFHSLQPGSIGAKMQTRGVTLLLSVSSPSSRAVRAGAGIPASGGGAEAPVGTGPAMKWGSGCCVFGTPSPAPPHSPPIPSHPSVCWSPGFSLFMSFSVSQGSWRSSKEQRLSPSRPGDPRETHSPSKDRPQVSSRPGAPSAWRPRRRGSLGAP